MDVYFYFFLFFKLSTALLFPKLYNNIVQHLLKIFDSTYNNSLIPAKSFPQSSNSYKMHKVHKNIHQNQFLIFPDWSLAIQKHAYPANRTRVMPPV